MRRIRGEHMDMRALSRFAAIAVLANCLLATPAPAPAQEPTPGALAAARDMLATKGSMRVFDAVIPRVIESVKNSLLPTNLNVSRELNEVAALLSKEYDPKRDEISADITRIFAQRFSEKELKDLTAFYKTPLGQKLVREEPAAIEESFQRAQRWADQFSDTVMSRFRSEMQKKGHPI
jgi:uncharacterized protein